MRIVSFCHILLVSLALAGYSAWVLEQRRTENLAPPISGDAILDISLLRQPEANALWHEASTLFLDVRSPADFAVGRIAGALSCPDEEFEQQLAALRPRLERARIIIVYCKSVDCGKSLWAALRLRKEGLSQVAIYPGGWNEWVNAGLPVERSLW